jgi:hypothetical protein
LQERGLLAARLSAGLTLSGAGSRSRGRASGCTIYRRGLRAGLRRLASGVARGLRTDLLRRGQGGAPTREAAEHLARNLCDILWRRHEEERARRPGFAPRAARSQCAHSDSTFRAASRFRRSRGGMDVGELGCALADPARHLRNRAPQHKRRQAGRRVPRVPLPLRRLVAPERAHAQSPLSVLMHMRERWPELSFKLTPSYLQTV